MLRFLNACIEGSRIAPRTPTVMVTRGVNFPSFCSKGLNE